MTLRTAFNEKVVPDYQKLRPKEWSYLNTLTKRKSHYDFIFDGLNVSYHQQGATQSVLAQAKSVRL